MNITKIASAAAFTLATTVGLTIASVVVPTAAQAESTSCQVYYGNTLLKATFNFSARNVSVDWTLTAASGSGSKRVELQAYNSVENTEGDDYGAWVSQGTRRSGTVTATPASSLPGGYSSALLYLHGDSTNFLATLIAKRDGTCREL